MRKQSLAAAIAILLPLVALLPYAHAVPNTFQTCDIFTGVGGGQINWYRPNACPGIPSAVTLQGTLHATGFSSIGMAGMSFDVNGECATIGQPCLYATTFNANTAAVFDVAGTFLGTCGGLGKLDPTVNSNVESAVVVPGYSGGPSVFFGQADGDRNILRYPLPCTPTSTLQNRYTVATGPRGTDWIDMSSDLCNMHYTSEGVQIKSFNVCTSTQNPNFAIALTGANAYAHKILSDGSELVADTGFVVHVSNTGANINTCISSAAAGGSLFSMDILPDQNAFAAANLGNLNKVYYQTVAACDAGTAASAFSFTGIQSGQTGQVAGTAIYGEFTSSNPPPEANPLTASKTATPSFIRTFGWSISKSVDKIEVETAAGGSATFTYTVTVTHDSGTDSNWQVTGTITVTNPNTAPVTSVSVTDAINDANAVCTVTGGSDVTIPESSSSTFSYSCTYSAAPGSSSETNTATVTWSAQTLSNGQSLSAGNAMGTAPISWDSVTPTIVDGSVSVTDTLGSSLGTVSYTDSNPISFTYSIMFTGDTGGTCTAHDNTATFTTITTGTTGSASASVTVCVGADLTVSKTATPSFTRTYLWSILKSAGPTPQTITAGGTATFNYTVTVTETGFTDSNWMVSGAITVTNPNDWEAITLTNVIDEVDNGGTCAVTGNTGATILALGSLTLSYTCSYTSAPSSSNGTNTATVMWDSTTSHTPDGSAMGVAGFTFNDGSSGNPQKVNQVVTATDTFNGGAPTTLGTLTASDSTPFTTATYVYSHTLSGVSGKCTAYSNTAMLVETGQTASATVTLCVVPSSVVPPSTVTNTAFCAITGNVNLIYTQGSSSTYQLTSSNPGQFYDNIFFVGTPGDSVRLNVQIPYPFVTSGARPIQLSSVQVSNPSISSCLVPNFDNQTPLMISGTTAGGASIGTMSSSGYLTVTLGAYDVSTPSPAPMGTHVTLVIAGMIPSTGLFYLTIHLSYGFKGTTGWTPSPSGCTLSGAGANCNAVNPSPAVTISYGQTYTFPVTITDTTTSTTITQSPSISTVNTFKKDPGFTGSAFFTADAKVVS